jgi:hypothetical protein
LKNEIVSNFWETIKPFKTILKASNRKRDFYELLSHYHISGIVDLNPEYETMLKSIKDKIISLCTDCEIFVDFDNRIKYSQAVYLHEVKDYSFEIFSKGFIFDRDEPLTFENSCYFRLGLDSESEDN